MMSDKATERCFGVMEMFIKDSGKTVAKFKKFRKQVT